MNDAVLPSCVHWLPVALTVMGQRASKELISAFHANCRSEMLPMVMVLGTEPGEKISSRLEKRCRRIFGHH